MRIAGTAPRPLTWLMRCIRTSSRPRGETTGGDHALQIEADAWRSRAPYASPRLPSDRARSSSPPWAAPPPAGSMPSSSASRRPSRFRRGSVGSSAAPPREVAVECFVGVFEFGPAGFGVFGVVGRRPLRHQREACVTELVVAEQFLERRAPGLAVGAHLDAEHHQTREAPRGLSRREIDAEAEPHRHGLVEVEHPARFRSAATDTRRTWSPSPRRRDSANSGPNSARAAASRCRRARRDRASIGFGTGSPISLITGGWSLP